MSGVDLISRENTLVCVFSYNMTFELRVLVQSMRDNLPGFDVLVIDDASTTPITRQILSENSDFFSKTVLQSECEKTNSRGRLAENIQYAYDVAKDGGYEYLFLIQDDMQFLREVGEDILSEYSQYFLDERVIQVDPRFLRRLGDIYVDKKSMFYHFDWQDDRSSYADVGIIKVSRLVDVGWEFDTSERRNKVKANKMGLKRVFPFRPVAMHLPYPVIYRKGRRKNKFPAPFVRRGRVYFEYLSDEFIDSFDHRPLEVIPYARDFLKPRNLGLARLHYMYANEGRVFA